MSTDSEDVASWLASVARAVRHGDIPPEVVNEAINHHRENGERTHTEISLLIGEAYHRHIDALPDCVPQQEWGTHVAPPTPTPGTKYGFGNYPPDDEDDDEPDEADWQQRVERMGQQSLRGFQGTADGLASIALALWPWLVFAAGWPITVGWWVDRTYEDRYSDPEGESYLMTALFGGLLWMAFWLVMAVVIGGVSLSVGLVEIVP